MVLVEGVPCLDGGISVAIPYQKAIEEGYDKIVVVTTREHGFRKPQVSRPMARMYARYYGKYPNLVRCLVDVPRMYAKELDEIDRLEAQGKLFVIRPPKPVTVSHLSLIHILNPGIAFVVTFLGGTVLGSFSAGWLLFLSVTAAGILLGVFTGLDVYKRQPQRSSVR